MWCDVILAAIGVLLVLWFVHFFIQWVLNDDVFFDGGYWPEHDHEEDEEEKKHEQ